MITRRINHGIQEHDSLTQDTQCVLIDRNALMQVPSDADIVLSAMEAEQEEQMYVPVPPSTLQEDSVLARSLSSDCGTSMPNAQGRVHKLLEHIFSVKCVKFQLVTRILGS